MRSTKHFVFSGIAITTMLTTSVALAVPPTLTISNASAVAGSAASVNLTLNNNGSATIAALTSDITYDAGKLTPANASTAVPGKIAQGNVLASGTYRITVYGGVNIIPDGTVATVTFTTTSGQCGAYPLDQANGSPTASDASANPVAITGVAGSVTTTGCSGNGCTGPYDLIIPAAAHSNGQWQSDVDLLNDTTGDAAVDIALLKQNQANASPSVYSVTVPPGQAMRIPDILGTTALSATNAALGIRFCRGDVAANSRFYNTATGGHGTYGMWVPGLAESAAVTPGVKGTFHLLTYSTSSSSGFRVNIGLANAQGTNAAVVIRLYGDDGLQIGAAITKTLRAYEQVQYTKIHQSVSSGDVAHGWATVEVTTAGAKVHAYAMLIDNASSDPIYMPVDLR
jgi:hypothetical protein